MKFSIVVVAPRRLSDITVKIGIARPAEAVIPVASAARSFGYAMS